jgi:hypothetical protein
MSLFPIVAFSRSGGLASSPGMLFKKYRKGIDRLPAVIVVRVDVSSRGPDVRVPEDLLDRRERDADRGRTSCAQIPLDKPVFSMVDISPQDLFREVVMKRVLLVVFLFSVVGSAFMLAQDQPNSPFSWERKKFTADGLYTGKTYDEVWAALIKTFMVDWKIIKSDKDSGLISATTRGTDQFDLLVEKRDNGSGVICKLVTKPDVLGVYAKNMKKIYEKTAVNLYGEDVIPKKGKGKK